MGLQVKYLLFLLDLNLNYLVKIGNKFRPVGDYLFHADGKTGRSDEANSRSTQFWERVY
jgi:hypothetical protein